MNLSVSILQSQRRSSIAYSPGALLRLGFWLAALPALMFLVPQTGLHWIAWDYPVGVGPTFTDIVGGLMALLTSSILPAVIVFEAREARKRGALSKTGLAVFVLLSMLGTILLGLVFPQLYATYLHLDAYFAAFPYLMALGGLTVWVAMLYARKLIARQG